MKPLKTLLAGLGLVALLLFTHTSLHAQEFMCDMDFDGAGRLVHATRMQPAIFPYTGGMLHGHYIKGSCEDHGHYPAWDEEERQAEMEVQAAGIPPIWLLKIWDTFFGDDDEVVIDGDCAYIEGNAGRRICA
jgi:hypothetical protein